MNIADSVNILLPTPSLSKRKVLDRAGGQYSFRSYRHELQQLFWECTLRCNLHCQHCGSDCRSVSKTKDMPLEDFLNVLDDVRTVMDPEQLLVVTTGGEPLLRPDICECGKAIRKRGGPPNSRKCGPTVSRRCATASGCKREFARNVTFGGSARATECTCVTSMEN